MIVMICVAFLQGKELGRGKFATVKAGKILHPNPKLPHDERIARGTPMAGKFYDGHLALEELKAEALNLLRVNRNAKQSKAKKSKHVAKVVGMMIDHDALLGEQYVLLLPLCECSLQQRVHQLFQEVSWSVGHISHQHWVCAAYMLLHCIIVLGSPSCPVPDLAVHAWPVLCLLTVPGHLTPDQELSKCAIASGQLYHAYAAWSVAWNLLNLLLCMLLIARRMVELVQRMWQG